MEERKEGKEYLEEASAGVEGRTDGRMEEQKEEMKEEKKEGRMEEWKE